MEIPYQVVNLEDVSEKLILTEELMFDTESAGLYKTIQLAQFYQKGWDHVLMVRRPDIIELIKLLNRANLVIQNSAYDITTIQAQSRSRWIPANLDDLLYLGRLKWYTETKFSLDNLMLCALGYDPYLALDIDKKEFQKSDWSGELSEKQWTYAAIDVYHMPDVFDQCKEYIDDDNYILDMATLRHALDFQNNGFPVDERKRLAMEMRNDMKIEEYDMPINVNSWKQVRPYIGEDESDGLALARFTIYGNQRASDVRDVRKLRKQNSFLKKFDSPDGRIYGKFAPSARSGRFTCKDQNLQQLPRATKGIFGYREGEGKVLIYSDYPQLELRSVCAVTGEEVMANLFRKGEDLHTYVMNMISTLSTMDKGRQIAKTLNFNLLYGGGANMFGSILVKDALIMLKDKQLYRLKDAWKVLWPTISAWQEQGITDWDDGIAWETPLGRRYVGKMMTDQMNIQIQGAGADVAKLALHKICKQIKEFDGAVRMLNFQHDSYILECPEDQTVYSDVAQIVGESMQEAWVTMSQYFEIKDLPMPVDVSVGYNWGDIEDDDKTNLYDLHID